MMPTQFLTGTSGAPFKGSKHRAAVRQQMRKTRMCIFYAKGACEFSNTCMFAHTPEELQAGPDFFKTQLCKAFMAGKCDDKQCEFAHGEHELRKTDAFVKMKLCVWNVKGLCRNGE